ncbi:glycogen debranching N-terminal domain-containing protein [Microbacterium hydrocarbonoxydans]|uniref:glycogen debranching N-terminal domain-containing protein n=1 Tax=Microbacterium hydrocarbonoxydans TaxID=273678 RepID=UPI00203E4126|nr:glycogen debranching N-terminal domain-containing protein [Microbacterium hydrocarbonoxydans]MCM3780913.1 amylo-alpha-1,6-glucosidase [Microbacterium hydrocarbonoxydans]
MTDRPHLQPLLDDAVIVLDAPTQVWSDRAGRIGTAPIHGVFHGDVRHIAGIDISVRGTALESIGYSSPTPRHVRFTDLLRGLDDAGADPKVRLDRDRTVTAGRFAETLRFSSHLEDAVEVAVEVRVRPDFAPMQLVKAGEDGGQDWTWDGERCRSGEASFALSARGAEVSTDGRDLVVAWRATISARGAVELSWEADLDDSSLVVTTPARAADTRHVGTGADPRAARWLDRATADLDALRLALPDHPADAFYAAGAPWFFTLFGRDSIWAARLALASDPAIAGSTLRVLARLQGTAVNPHTAEAPGKIAHELRSAELSLPGEGVLLPPLYYGTVDATPLWVCLLADARDAGMPEHDLRELVPALRAALDWMVVHGDASGSGFIDYADETGHGLANQGWKDSGDSIQWRDGRLAEGPIALSEVQGYAYEAAVRGAALLDELGEPGGDALRSWAADLRTRFRAAYWVTTPEGRYPAIALDAHGAAVDTLTSNIGHLIGTGLLDADEERACAELLLGTSMSSGYGIRTMSTDAAGYWPLSYHGGSVWTHDTAIAVHGMRRAGLVDEARHVAGQLLDLAEGFDYRVPELHSGEPRVAGGAPVPYPAACRPQAWSAAAAVVTAAALR